MPGRRDGLGVLQSLARLERRTRLVRSAGAAFSFDHHLLGETLHAALPEALRRAYHGRLASAIASVHRLDLARPDAMPGDAAVRLVEHLLRGPRPQDAEPLLARAIDWLRTRNAHAALCETVDLALTALPNLAPASRCDLLLGMAEAAGTLGRTEEQMTAVEGAIAAAAEAGDRTRSARCCLDKGRALVRVRPAEAAVAAEEAIRLARRAGDEEIEGRARILLAAAMSNDDRVAESRAETDKVMELAARRQDRSLECKALIMLGKIHGMQDDPETAVDILRRSLRLAEELGLANDTYDARNLLAIHLHAAGRIVESSRCFERNVIESRARGARGFEGGALGEPGPQSLAPRGTG